ncbi:MAG: universal stress protein [Rhizobiales bacterium]|nr:universal stress protein [Hyphomicrobiales bacterium]
MKDLIVKLEHDKSHDQALNFAVSVAETFNAHLAGVAYGNLAGMPDYGMAGVPGSVIAEILAQSEQAARTALTRFHALAGRNGISISDHLVLDTGFGTAETFATFARHYDLSILRQTDDEGPDNGLIIEAALFNTGRPAIVVPYIQSEELKLERVLCCWDGGAPAARAVNDALPFLKRAGTVEILNVTRSKDDTSHREIRGMEIANHLARHDVQVEIETTSAPDRSIADVILSHAADKSADLIVMGGYGHSRLREFVLGGVTRDILRSMTVPAFLSR